MNILHAIEIARHQKPLVFVSKYQANEKHQMQTTNHRRVHLANIKTTSSEAYLTSSNLKK